MQGKLKRIMLRNITDLKEYKERKRERERRREKEKEREKEREIESYGAKKHE